MPYSTRWIKPWTDQTKDSLPKGGDSVTIPRVDYSYVIFLYLMFHHFLLMLPANPTHDPRGQHVI